MTLIKATVKAHDVQRVHCTCVITHYHGNTMKALLARNFDTGSPSYMYNVYMYITCTCLEVSSFQRVLCTVFNGVETRRCVPIKEVSSFQRVSSMEMCPY